jgi:hypothetical protein
VDYSRGRSALVDGRPQEPGTRGADHYRRWPRAAEELQAGWEAAVAQEARGTVMAGKPVAGEKIWLLSPAGVLRSPMSRGLLQVG